LHYKFVHSFDLALFLRVSKSKYHRPNNKTIATAVSTHTHAKKEKHKGRQTGACEADAVDEWLKNSSRPSMDAAFHRGQCD